MLSCYQPGQASETVIDPGVNINETTYNADPQVRFPIPNERELRRKKVQYEVTASRKILFQGDGSQTRLVTNLPYQPPGLRWKVVQQSYKVSFNQRFRRELRHNRKEQKLHSL